MSLIGDILPENHIILNLDVGSKKRVFEQVGVLLENHLGILRAEVFDCLFAREKLGSTGLGQGVAIPHGCIKSLKETVGVFVRTKEPIPFDAPDGQPVQLMFVLLAPQQENNDSHLQILSDLAQKFASKEILEKLKTAQDAATVRQIFIG
ncbi:PTS IIA-like nitrogen regulatory protein PtsN [Neisseria sp. Ec49-e6-T10]|uniref:PTS IIA-like nitrogen regulatory protein PtsN n=1 Tax=Neisseria sp. Ec49-e6-T10 TaxID=3140744 RepID=UPI003EB9A746